MKKKYLAVLLAAAMIACSGCTFLDNFGHGPHVPELDEIEEDDEDNDKEDKDDNNNKDGEGDGTGVVAVEPEKKGLAEGPDYVIGTYWDDYYFDHVTMTTSCDKVFLLNDGFDALQSTLDTIYSDYYSITVDYYSYDKVNEYGAADYNPDWGDDYWEDVWGFAVLRNDEKVFTLRASGSSYLGGVHGYYESRYYNINPANGEIITLRDATAGNEGYGELYNRVYDKLVEEYDTENEFNVDWDVTLREIFFSESFYGDRINYSWFPVNNGITVEFSVYTLAPYYMGEVSVTIPYEGNEDIFNEEYLNIGGETYKVLPAYDAGLTDFKRRIVDRLVREMGVWNYDDCTAFLDDNGLDYSYDEPYESESCGEIWVSDSDDLQWSMCLLFWPLDDTLEEYSKETDALYSVWYYNEDYQVNLSNGHNTGAMEYRVTDRNTYDTLKFDTAEDAWNYLGYVAH